MRQQRDFRTDAPGELRRQLQELEADVRMLARALPFATMAPLLVLATEARTEGFRLGPGGALGIVGTVKRIQLETPQARDAGRFAVVFARGAATVDIYAPAGSAVNTGAAFAWAPAAAAALLLFCDGLAYWTVGG
jgi:hypothetical protein